MSDDREINLENLRNAFAVDGGETTAKRLRIYFGARPNNEKMQPLMDLIMECCNVKDTTVSPRVYYLKTKYLPTSTATSDLTPPAKEGGNATAITATERKRRSKVEGADGNDDNKKKKSNDEEGTWPGEDKMESLKGIVGDKETFTKLISDLVDAVLIPSD